MKQLSIWAAHNVRLTRWLIVGCYLMAGALGTVWALLLYASDMRLPASLFWMVLALTVVALLSHPAKWKEKAAHYSYDWHKLCDLVLCFATVFMIASANLSYWRAQPPSIQAASFNKKEKPVSMHETSTVHESRISKALNSVRH